MPFYISKAAFRRAVVAEARAMRDPSDLILWHSENRELLKAAAAGYYGVDPENLPGEAQYRPLAQAIRAFGRSLRAARMGMLAPERQDGRRPSAG